MVRCMLARERFEQRMYEIGKPFGDSIHGQGIPDEVVPGWYTKGCPDSGGSCCSRKPEGSCSTKKPGGGGPDTG